MAKKEYYDYDFDDDKVLFGKRKKGKVRIFSKIDKWEVLKSGVSMAASGCATVVVSKYLKANMPEAESMVDKFIMGAGAYFITGLVGSKVAEYCDKELDDFRRAVKAASVIEDEKELEDGE